MTSFDIERRKMLQASGAALLTGLAGCTGILADGTGVPGKSPPVEEPGENGENNVPPEVDEWLSDANEYEGELADHTGEDEVVIEVGAGSSGVAFNEPAVQVDPGTTIVWEWTGEGGSHNVEVNEGPTEFTSETVEEEGHAFSQELEAGNYRYQCGPHSTLGMHGAVIVEEE